jgi:undecaprenyl pyrophosphate phosphatase UppP
MAGLSGFAAIAALMKILVNGHLRLFSYYCWIVGGIVLISLR